MRRCSQCQVEDKPAPPLGDGEFTKPEHTVITELRFITAADEVTPQKRRAGWWYRLWKGRHAMCRFICRPCLIAAEDMGREQARVRREHLRLEQAQRGETNIYGMYNEEYV